MTKMKTFPPIYLAINNCNAPCFARNTNDRKEGAQIEELVDSHVSGRFIIRSLAYRDLDSIYQYYSKDIDFAYKYVLSRHEIKRWLIQSIDSNDQISIAIEIN